jgi:hypothetical protein
MPQFICDRTFGNLLNSSYSYGSILKLWWQSGYGRLSKRYIPRVPSPWSVICSQLYADAYGKVCKRTLDDDVYRPVTPASLSCTDCLQDVPTNWLTID